MSEHAHTWRTWRKKKLMSQSQLAAALGITKRTVLNVEAGHHQPSYTTQARFRDLVERHRKNGRKG